MDRAIEIVEVALATYGPPVYVRKEIVHNPFVVSDLRKKGAVFVESEEEAPQGSVLIFSAHGVSPEVRKRAEARNLRAIDATCPLVTKVHLEAKKYVKDGYSVLLIGHAGHDEITGTLGEAPEQIQLIENPLAAKTVQVRDPSKVVCLTQTTLSVDDTREVVETLKQRFPNILVRNDICYATQNRQTAVRELATRADVIIVVGAANSSNSVRLVEVAAAQGVRAHRVNDASEIEARWLDGATSVGVTSGASTPELKVAEVVEALRNRGAGRVEEVTALEEHVTFALPKGLAPNRPAARS